MTITASLKATLCVLIVAAGTVTGVRGQGNTVAQQAAAETWVALVDGAQYAASWETAAAFFRNAVPQQKWAEAAAVARGPLGSLTSRTLKSSTATKSLPGAPDGEYVVFQFNTTFEKKAAAVETVTVFHEPDGQWRVVGYFVR